MILVSMKIPEEIPWFKASRRAVVADMFVRGWCEQGFYRSNLYDSVNGPYALRDSEAEEINHVVQISGA